jgi:uncharacterized protein YdhG (YjbR/CyaY superfamily)
MMELAFITSRDVEQKVIVLGSIIKATVMMYPFVVVVSMWETQLEEMFQYRKVAIISRMA